MADTATAPPTPEQLENGAKAVRLYLRKMHRPERAEPGATLWFALFYAVIALFPIAFVVGLAAVLPNTGDMNVALKATPPHPAVAQVNAEIKATLDAYAARMTKPPSSSAPAPSLGAISPNTPKADAPDAVDLGIDNLTQSLRAAELVEKLNARHSDANPPVGLEGAQDAHKTYASVATLAATSLIWVALVSAALVSQTKLLWRQWDNLDHTEKPDGYLATVPILAPVLFAGGCGWLIWYLQDVLVLPRGLTLPPHWVAPYVLAGCAVALATMLFVSVFAAMTAARNYPSALAAQRIARAFHTAGKGRPKGTSPSKIVVEYFEHRYPRSKAQTGDAAFTAQAIPIAANHHPLAEPRHPNLKTGPRVDLGLSATQCLTIVRTTSTLAAVVMVVTLALLSYGLSLLPVPADSAAYEDDIRASGNALVMALGAAMSVSLFAIFGLGYMRLKPFAETESPRPATPKPKGWSLTGLLKQQKLKIDTEPKKSPAPKPDPFAEYAVAMGATKAKFVTILKGSNQGAAFHGLMEESLTSQILKLLGLLSPALAGGVLTFLG